MKLSIMDPGTRPSSYRLHLRHADWVSTWFATDLTMCDNPCCGCTEIDFSCTTERQDDPHVPPGNLPWCFSLDVHERRIGTERPRSVVHPRSSDLARAVAAELTSEDWEKLLQLLAFVKREQIANAKIDQLRPTFPPEVMEGEETVVGYVEVFPFDAGLSFEVCDEPWFADDQYCVNPACPCVDATLTFLRVPPPSSSGAIAAAHAPAVFYDYRTGAFKTVTRPRRDDPGLDDLVGALRRAQSDLHATLEKRHRQLRLLFQRAIRGRRRHGRRPASGLSGTARTVRPSVGGEAIWQPPPSATPPPGPTSLSPVKAGRNDPCPCGSGKKFKKCCGRS
jgi:hypothetical protein